MEDETNDGIVHYKMITERCKIYNERGLLIATAHSEAAGSQIVAALRVKRIEVPLQTTLNAQRWFKIAQWASSNRFVGKVPSDARAAIALMG